MSKFGFRHKRSEDRRLSDAPGFVIKCPVVQDSSRRDIILALGQSERRKATASLLTGQ